MNFTAAMRLGSLEMLGALAAFGFVAARMRLRDGSPGHARAISVSLEVREGVSRAPARELIVTVPEGSPLVIGRSGQADVDLADPEVSRRHARLDLVQGVLYVADLGSSNGTFLNGKRLSDESIELRPGDDIDVGNTRVTVTGTVPEP